MEDSISSSPSKSNKSIRETRLKRKTKRKQIENNEQINDHESNKVDFGKSIHDFYYQDSDNDSLVNDNTTFTMDKIPAVVCNYKPFEQEKTLAIADRLTMKPINSNFVIQETQGFITCIDLKEMELDNETPGHLSITETQMLNCCDQAEQNLQLTPKEDELFLVNSILEDFSQSPLRKEQIKVHTNWQYTPEFQLRQKPIKTYGREFLNKIKTNLNERFVQENVNISDEDDNLDDDGRSSNSSLSIQEDVTVGEFPNNQTSVTNLDNSRLCENLLNLSVYFTQNNNPQDSLSCEDEYNQEQMTFSSNVSYLIKDILAFHSIYQKNTLGDSFNSIEDFLGFPEHKDHKESNTIDVDVTEHNSLNTTLNITQDLCDNKERLQDTSFNEEVPLIDWNDDDCQDIFAGINTENILVEQNFTQSIAKKTVNEVNQDEKHDISENPLQIQMSNKIIDFKNASAKARETQIMADKILSKLPDIPQKPLPPIEKEIVDSSTEIHKEKTKNFKENCINNIGFQTASAKPIKVSREAHIMAAKILSNLPDIPTLENICDNKNLKDVNIFDNLENEEWNDDCDLLLNIQTPIISNEKPTTNINKQQETLEQESKLESPTTSKMTSLSFKTAAGNNVNISRKAQESVQKLLKEFYSDDLLNNYNYEEELKEIKAKVYTKSHNLEMKSIYNCKDGKEEFNTNLGFQTGRGKNIQISEKAQEKVKHLLNEFCVGEEELEIESDLEALKQEIYKKNKETMQYETNKPSTSTTNIDFQTAKGNKISTSSRAQESIEMLLKEKECNEQDLSDIVLSEWPLEKSMELRKNTTNNITNTTTDLNPEAFTEIPEQFKNNETISQDSKSNKTTNIGFQTANGKKVVISHNGQEMVKKLMQEFNTNNDDVEKYENDLKALKMKLQIKNKELKAQPTTSNTTKSSQDYKDIILSPKLITPQAIKGKRKYSIDNSEISPRINSSPPAKISKDISHSKSSLAEQSLKSPLTLAPYSLIARKNLLSLTKRRKNKRDSLITPKEEIPKINKEIYDINQDVVTPIKSCSTLRVPLQAPATPNLKEFFSEAPLTSTPRISQSSNTSQNIKDSDFEPINWKNNETTNNTTKLSENSSMNISMNSSNPTPKERIGRLKMYGKAPDVSPILIGTHNNYRPSGLRRTRSMLKKSE
ncbi:BRCA2, DNA repair associated [Cochliomyia hominivorax]